MSNEPSLILIVRTKAAERAALRATITASNPVGRLREIRSPSVAQAWTRFHAPDLVIIDLRRRDGELENFVRHTRETTGLADVPLLALADRGDQPSHNDGLDWGVSDFLMTPLNPAETRARITFLLNLNWQRRPVRDLKSRDQPILVGDDGEDTVDRREKETLLRLAKAGEYRDAGTGKHIVRMARNCRYIAEALGLSAEECERVEAAAPMHDIGKIGIADTLLRKPGKLTPTERKEMENHTLIGYEILKDSASPYLQLGAQIALAHHERYDGGGYPHALQGADIPIAARIVAVADVYDALTSDRPYKRAWSPADARTHLKAEKGRHFDPDCVDAFLGHIDSNGAIRL